MPWRYELRKPQLRAECAIAPEVFEGGIERLAECAPPFAAGRLRPEQRDHAPTSLAGRASDLAPTNTASIASRPDPEREGVPHFVGSASGDHRPLRRALARPVGRARGPPAGVIVFDPSGFAPKGNASVGVPRPWLGRLGKVDNGPVGIVLGSVSYRAQAWVDVRLSRPKEWAKDRARRPPVRRAEGGALPDAARAGAGEAPRDRAPRAARLGHPGWSSDRGVPATWQERGGSGRLPGGDVVGVAPPPGVVADRGMVPGAGGASGEKSDCGPSQGPRARLMAIGW